LEKIMKLSEMYEKRKALSGEIDALTNGTVKLDATNESRAAAMLDELDNMDSEIRRVGLRDRLDGGGVTSNLETGRPAASHKTEFRDWIAGGFRENNEFEMRASGVADFGATTTIASPLFQQMMDRMSVVRPLATVITTDSGAPLRFYRQTAQFAVATTVVAEAGAYVNKDVTTAAVDFTPTKMGFFTTVSNEALTDMVYDVASETIRQHAELHAYNRDLSYSNLTYNAFAQPIYDQTGSVGNVNSRATASGTNITLAEATNAVYASGLLPTYLADSSWLLPVSTWAGIISQASTNVPTFGQGANYSVARDGAGMSFMGFPVYISANLPQAAATTVSYGVFGDIRKGYRIVEMNAVPFLANPYVLAANGQVQFLSTTRSSGKIMDRNAMVTLKVT
jgi:HK97 family phage major capsid protein